MPRRPPAPPSCPVQTNPPAPREPAQRKRYVPPSSLPRFEDPQRDPGPTIHPWDEDAIAAAVAWVEDRREVVNKAPFYVDVQWRDGTWHIQQGHDDPYGFDCQLRQTLASMSREFCDAIVNQLLNGPNAASEKRARAVNDGLAFIHSMAPSNEAETLLYVQGWQAHCLATQQIGRAGRTDNIEHLAVYTNLGVKAGNMSARVFEAIAKLRGGGKQEVTVTHVHQQVHVADGGQAVVGNISRGGGGQDALDSQSLGAVASLAFAPGAAVWSEDETKGDAVPVASDAKRPMQNPRGQGRGAER